MPIDGAQVTSLAGSISFAFAANRCGCCARVEVCAFCCIVTAADALTHSNVQSDVVRIPFGDGAERTERSYASAVIDDR